MQTTKQHQMRQQERPEAEVLLAVVIVNYGTPAVLIDCLETLLPELDGLSARVVVVDNHSPDDSVPQIRLWLQENDPGSLVLLLESGMNGGFAFGNNVGIAAIEAEYYLLLNSDTLVRPGSLRLLLDAAEREPEAGLVSPRLEWPDGQGQESCFRYPTPVSEFMRAAQTGIIDGLLSRFIIALPVQTEACRPEWTSFACVLIRRAVLDQVGMLDEGYFMYYEDIEYCRRSRLAGWEIYHEPQAHIVHLRGGTSPVKQNAREKKRLPAYFYESRNRFFYQAYGLSGPLAANIAWSLGRVISASRQLLGRPDKAAVRRQWLDIWRNCLKPLSRYTHPEA